MIYSIRHKQSASGPDLAYRQYWRDNRDRITAWKRGTDDSQNRMENGRGDRYAYDEEGQLKTASYRTEDPEGSAGTPMRADSFAYDELGNRKEWNHIANRGDMWLQRRDNGLNQYSSWQNSYPNPPQHWGSPIYHDDTFGDPNWVFPGNGGTGARAYRALAAEFIQRHRA
jgi:hypothetical protein